jgi:GNAT superfamily N-acetyltransferase
VSPPAILIRPAVPADAPTILALIRALAAYERLADQVRITVEDLLRDGFGPAPRFECLLAELDGAAVGFALFFPNYSTFEGRAGLYVEDLFVLERARGLGIGRKLLARIAALALAQGGRRVELSVLHWNPARAFYARLGMVELADWGRCRLAGSALAALAAEA